MTRRRDRDADVAREKKPKPISLRAYARRRGVSAEAVSKAVKDERLAESVVLVDGKPKILDVELADREWKMNTRSRIDDDDDCDDEDGVGLDVPSYKRSVAVRAAHAARRESALADLAEIEVAERREELVPFEEAREYILNKFHVTKTRLLGVPSKFVQQHPHLTEVAPALESLLREAMDELAIDEDDDDGGDGEEIEDA